jgi:uncharacterized protein YbjT (DUF2867 family)
MSPAAPVDAVTGAFSYSGASIAAELQRRGRRVRTLTGHPERASSFQTTIDVRPLPFDDASALRLCLDGVDTLYNTYWVRMPRHGTTFAAARRNTFALFDAARGAGVRRIVHVSITHPDLHSPYPYFREKAIIEKRLAEVGVSHAVVRPAFFFGRDGVLINNVAWLLRHLPVVPVPGGGHYWMRGIHVDDLALLCADLGAGAAHVTVDAVGPERLTFRRLVECVRDHVAPRTPVVSAPSSAVLPLLDAISVVLRDPLLTRDEYRALAAGLADSTAPATGKTRFTEWVAANAHDLGRRYANDRRRHSPPRT